MAAPTEAEIKAALNEDEEAPGWSFMDRYMQAIEEEIRRLWKWDDFRLSEKERFETLLRSAAAQMLDGVARAFANIAAEMPDLPRSEWRPPRRRRR